MSVLHLNFTKPVIPLEKTTDAIRRGPTYCWVCLNLYADSAFVAFPRRGLWHNERDSEAPNIFETAEAGTSEPSPESGLTGTPGYEYSSFSVQINGADLADQAASGCASCTLLEAVLVRLSGNPLIFKDDVVVQLVFCRGTALRVGLNRVEASSSSASGSDAGSFASFPSIGGPVLGTMGESLGDFELYTLPGRLCPWPTIGPSMRYERPYENAKPFQGGLARHVLPDPKAEPCFALIREWISICADKHAVCHDADALASGLPKRVIHVGSADNSTICLVETLNLVPGSGGEHRYVALSHCWGQSQHLILTKSTIAGRKHNITWTSLPRTFQDAILITRKLGYEFLWIDSLCIIQDDGADWEAEAAKMASVYSEAHLVISATASLDGDGGCLFEREGFVEVEGTSHEGEKFDLFARRQREHNAFGRDALYFARHEDGARLRARLFNAEFPLFTRAWCFQERLLATRILHFASGEMIFDCLHGISCECGAFQDFNEEPLRLPRHLVKFEQNHMGHGDHLQLSSQIAEPDSIHSLWRRLVALYSEKRITHASDTLPALAGLANKWSRRMKSKKYFAGLWGDDILGGLCWESNEVAMDSFETLTTGEFIAPSWSWASTQQPVTFGSGDLEDVRFLVTIDLASSGCLLSGIDPFGGVKAGWLLVTGRTFEADFVRMQDFGPHAGTPKPQDHGTLQVKDVDYRFLFTPDNADHCRPLVGQELTCLLFSTNPPYIDGIRVLVLDSAPAACRVSLPPAVQNHSRVFCRIGIAIIDVERWDHNAASNESTFYIV